MTRATLLLLLAALAITATVHLSPSQSLTAGRTPPNSLRPLDAILAYSGAVGGDGSPSTGTGGPSPVGPGLTSVVVGGSGNQSDGAEDGYPGVPSVPSADLPDSVTLDIRDWAVATPQLSFVVRAGLASWMPEGYGSSYLALPEGAGTRVRLCGAGGCVVMVSNDAGPDRAMQRLGRIADIAVVVWERITGLPRSRGLAQISLTVLRRVH